MHHYQHHIGDFNSATRHLSRLERSIYRDLLDLYYDSEGPLTCDLERLKRKAMCSTPDEVAALESVLAEFFSVTPEGYRNARADREIEAYQRMKTGGKRGAEKRWADPTPKPSDGEAIPTPSIPQCQPITSNHKPNTSVPNGTAKDWLFTVGLGMLTTAGIAEKQARKVVGMWCKQHGDDRALEAMQAVSVLRPADPISAVQARLIGRGKPKSASQAWVDQLKGGGDAIEGTATRVH